MLPPFGDTGFQHRCDSGTSFSFVHGFLKGTPAYQYSLGSIMTILDWQLILKHWKLSWKHSLMQQGMLHQDASWQIQRTRFNVSQVKKKKLHVFQDKGNIIKLFVSDVKLKFSWRTESSYAHIYHFHFKADATLILCTSRMSFVVGLSFLFYASLVVSALYAIPVAEWGEDNSETCGHGTTFPRWGCEFLLTQFLFY